MATSAWHQALADTEQFRKASPAWFWGVEVVMSGTLSGLTAWVLWDESRLQGWQVGLITFGVFVVGLFLIYGLIFLWKLLKAPHHLRSERRRKFIQSEASYISKFFGDPAKRKNLAILNTLKALIRIENKVANSMFGKHTWTLAEHRSIQTKLKQRIKKFSAIKPLGRYSVNDFTKAVNRGIKKLGLQVTPGALPTAGQTEFLLKMRNIMDESGVGLLKGLVENDKYKKLLGKLEKQVPATGEKMPEWIIWCLAIPSGLNSIYLFWSYQTQEYRKRFPAKTPTVKEFKSERARDIKDMMQHIRKMIDSELQED